MVLSGQNAQRFAAFPVDTCPSRGPGEAVQPEKGYGVENCLGLLQTPRRQVHYPGDRPGCFLGWRFGELYMLLSLSKLEDTPYCKD
jgi:hypothetical protein